MKGKAVTMFAVWLIRNMEGLSTLVSGSLGLFYLDKHNEAREVILVSKHFTFEAAKRKADRIVNNTIKHRLNYER